METIKVFAKQYYKIFSLIWLFLGSALYFINYEPLKKWYYYILLAIIVFVGIIIDFCFKHKVRHKIQSLDTDIEIVCQDILSYTKGSIVIPLNDVFDTELGDIISIDSIQGQFTQRIYKGNISKLNDDINVKLNEFDKYSIYEEEKAYGKKKRYPIGTVIDIGTTPKYLLSVVAKMENTNKKALKVTADDLWIVLSNLWEFNRSKNSIDEIVIPVIGTGFGRISSNTMTVIKMMLLSFYQKSKEEKIASKLTLVVRKDKISKTSLYEVQEFLANLT